MQKITPFLWFDDQAEEAVKFYTSVFKNSKIGRILRYSEEAAKASGRPAGSVLTVEFEMEGQKFVALNGGPLFKFNESISFVVASRSNCFDRHVARQRFQKVRTRHRSDASNEEDRHQQIERSVSRDSVYDRRLRDLPTKHAKRHENLRDEFFFHSRHS